MQIAYEVLHKLSDGKFHSGTALAVEFKVSRSSVWKAINFLRKAGLKINAVKGRGCRWEKTMELLNKNKIISKLSSYSLTKFPRIDVVNVIPSTNDYLIARLNHHISSGTVCTAEGQTKGKGRMGRVWRSPVGSNIYLSIYWRFPIALNNLSGLSLVASLGVLDALMQIKALPNNVGIKWPNDLWCDGQKLCGILTEIVSKNAVTPNSAYTDIIIGIGLNVCLPDLEKQNDQLLWTDLTKIWGFTPSRNDLIAHCLNSLGKMFSQFEVTGFMGFNQLWQHHDLLYGKKVLITTPKDKQNGIAQGVNEKGELLVKIKEQLKAIRYGEVSVKPEPLMG